MKKMPTSNSNLRRYAPLIVIGGILLFLSVVFLIVSQFLLSNRSDEVTEALENRKEGEPPAAVVFRDDATLVFKAADSREISSISIEIADSEESRQQGLMGRTRMSESQGMLFIFPDEDYRSFWMANTPLPLDIIYINSQKTIVTIRRNTVPFSEESIPSTAPARYVVEVNAGYCDRHGILEGATVSWIQKGG